MDNFHHPIKYLLRQTVSIAGASLLFALLLGLYTSVTQLWPTSFWFEVRSVHINDTVAGTPATMDVDRTVHRPFHARWVAEVERETDGAFAAACTASGENNYNPEAAFPTPLDLDWWTWPIECRPGPGRYQVETRWTIVSPFWPDKEIVFRSNTFTIESPQ